MSTRRSLGVKTVRCRARLRPPWLDWFLSSNEGTLEHAQQIAGHASPRTTKLYDRKADTVTLDEIERIVI